MPRYHKVHPAADLFPMLCDAELQELAADIKQNGQRYPITLWRGMVVDGRNRLAACKIAGVEPEFCDLLDEVDPVALVISENVHRRHLTPSQRAVIAEGLANLKHGAAGNGRKVESQICDSTLVTRPQAAELLNTSTRAMDQVREVKKKAAPVVVEAIKAGELKVHAAKKLVDAVPDKQQQAAIVKQGPEAVKAAVKDTPPKPRAEKHDVPSSRVPVKVAVNEFVEVWRHQENRLSILLGCLELLEPHEREVIRDRFIG